MLRFHRTWAAFATVLLVIELCIALFVHDRIVRPYVGDALVVMLIFFTLLAVVRARPLPLAVGVLLFAIAVEITQGLGLITRLGLENSTAAKLVLGNTFQWGDLVCYLIGTVFALGIVRIIPSERQGP